MHLADAGRDCCRGPAALGPGWVPGPPARAQGGARRGNGAADRRSHRLPHAGLPHSGGAGGAGVVSRRTPARPSGSRAQRGGRRARAARPATPGLRGRREPPTTGRASSRRRENRPRVSPARSLVPETQWGHVGRVSTRDSSVQGELHPPGVQAPGQEPP